MTRDKDRKRIIRTRMESTGESYTTARGHVLARSAKSRSRSIAKSPEPAPVDAAAIAGKSDETIRRQTGHSWEEWVRLLNADGAATLRHGELARLIHDKYGIGDWWSQTVAVGYERLTGRRERGQRMDGAFEVSKSKTMNVPMAKLFRAWEDGTMRRRWLEGIETKVRTATAEKSMRLQWPDGTIVAVSFISKGAGKSAVNLAHSKLPSKEAMEQAKADWSARLEALAHLLDADKA